MESKKKFRLKLLLNYKILKRAQEGEYVDFNHLQEMNYLFKLDKSVFYFFPKLTFWIKYSFNIYPKVITFTLAKSRWR